MLLVDGPGQGGALVEQGLVFRPDWEAVMTPQIDWLLERPEIDPTRVVLGRSWAATWRPGRPPPSTGWRRSSRTPPCEAGAASLFGQRVFAWLDETLARRRPSSAAGAGAAVRSPLRCPDGCA